MDRADNISSTPSMFCQKHQQKISRVSDANKVAKTKKW